MKKLGIIICGIVIVMAACNNGLTASYSGVTSNSKIDRSQRTVIDAAEYVDFTVVKYNAMTTKREDVFEMIGDRSFSNGNSKITINSREGTIEFISDAGIYNGKRNCQIYAKFGVEVMAASSDCLYLRRNPRVGGNLIIDNVTYVNDQIPDLPVCLPLYGYSRNRIEVSSVMNGFIVMPSGTYWYK